MNTGCLDFLQKKKLDESFFLLYGNEPICTFKSKEHIINVHFPNLEFKRINLDLEDNDFIERINRLTFDKLLEIFNNNIENKVLSDCLESVIGCIYLDQGLEVAEKFIIKNWKKYLNKSLITERDSKTKLQEYSLKTHKTLPIYKLIENKGPRHKPLIKVSVKIKNSKNTIGVGNSKKEAEQIAAKKLLDTLK